MSGDQSLGVTNEIFVERLRQVHSEGWTPAHDDAHADGALAIAASCYARHAGSDDDDRQVNSGFHPPGWPWIDFWKPSCRRRDLIKAAALIVAEIERLDRAASAKAIAAAPDLLAALELVWDTYGMDPSVDSAIWQTVRAAVAKATGGMS